VTIELVATCFRFAGEGDEGAGGSVGGVRVPLADMVMVKRAVRDARCASDVVGEERALSGRTWLLGCLLHQHSSLATGGRPGVQLGQRGSGT
jgi:hypothetical protein